MNELNPGRILETGFAFFSSKALLAAVGCGLFTRLRDESLTGPELGQALEWHPRAVDDFLDTLVALKFLDRDGDGAGARYRNTAETRQFLVKGEPSYVGGILEMANDRLYPFWGDLNEALRTAQPQNELKHSQKSMFEELYSDEARLEQFMSAMAGISRGNFGAFAAAFDFSQYQTLCDVGGASGVLSIEVASANPHLRCTSFDLPAVEPIAKRHIEAAGLAERIETASGDFFAAPLPQADVITMGMILHDWNLEKKKHLIRAAYDALPEGGAFVVIEALIDDARREHAFGLLMSLNMLIEFGDAFDYSAKDFRGWCEEVGFGRFEVLPLGPNHGAAVAYK